MLLWSPMAYKYRAVRPLDRSAIANLALSFQTTLSDYLFLDRLVDSGVMPSPWTGLNERKLLLCIIDQKNTFKWQHIAQSMGPQFSAEACRFHTKLTARMPYQWTPERERRMLLVAIASANLKPSADTWTKVSQLLGGGLTPSAVSQKYYKLRNEFAKLPDGGQPPSSSPTSTSTSSSTPSTPTKRKVSDSDGSEEEEEPKKPTPPSKRARKTKREALDGVPFSNSSGSFTSGIREEDMAAKVMTMTPGNMFEQQQPYNMHEQFFIPVNMPAEEDNARGVNNGFSC
ncbi:hypothetical protein PV08_08938 [Exophiala spinifera]|uniref:Myb-like domain-containing protein n=1 Tax=Exophiala spinifera TaxID=91928 RepID=A0A0D1ZLN2_9EURO|nr:uncharacterized protein PV08_08938 [Exophiala spinifera]KIW13747.1 hypothetical protein PV08_08938 [Exophiala spinifera]